MKILWTLLAISLIWCILAFSCNSPQTPGNSGPGPDQHTKKGVTVVSPVVVPDAALDAIDRGIQKAIDRAPANWTGGRDFREGKVQFVPAEGTNSQGAPIVQITSNGQTMWAWGYTSGYNLNDPSGKSDNPVIVIPYQTDWAHPEWVEGVAWSEWEHHLERKAAIQLNQPEIFLVWYRAGVDDNHPHRP